MKIGLSTYSLFKAMKAKEMDVLEVIQWTKDHGGKHIEIVPSHGFEVEDDPELVDAIRLKAEELGLEISNYAMGASFVNKDEEGYESEIQRVMKHVDIVNRLGAKSMRHDVAWRPVPKTGIMQFEQDLPRMVKACQRIADYAAQYGITTNVENHGFFVQASDRVQRLVQLVDRPNFKTIIDVGNFLCVDEDPVSAVKKNLPYASMIHLKDFYYRPADLNPGEGWFSTSGGIDRLRIFGQIEQIFNN